MMPRTAFITLLSLVNRLTLIFVLFFSSFVTAEDNHQIQEPKSDIRDTFFLVSKPVVQVRSGPGSRFPARFSLRQNASIRSINRRHLWVEVQTTDGRQGWVRNNQISPMPTQSETLVAVFPPKPVKPNLLDSERWELGVYTGNINIEDFGSHSIVGVTGNYHLNEWAFLKTNFATTSLDRPSFLDDNSTATSEALQTSAQKRYFYYFLSLGTYLFPGESFISPKTVWKSHISTDLGFGVTYINEEAFSTYRLGVGYHLFPMDWLSLSINTSMMRFNHNIFGNEQSANASELSIGLKLYL